MIRPAHLTQRLHGLLSAAALTVLLAGCASMQRTPVPAPQTCTFSYSNDESILSECKALAARGDTRAAFILGSFYSSPRGGHDPRAAIDWYTLAGDRGHLGAIRELFDAYNDGSLVPRNSVKADEYLTRAVKGGAQWAQLVLARRLEKTEPQRALDLYLDAARYDNCHAQARLAQAYKDGDIVQRNLTQAYFWSLLAQTGGTSRRSDYHRAAGLPEGDDCLVAAMISRLRVFELERSLPGEFVRIAQDAATGWRPGLQETLLPGAPVAGTSPSNPPVQRVNPPVVAPPPPESPSASEKAPPARRESPRSEALLQRLPQWIPLPSSGELPPTTAPQEAAELFAVASRSVWLVVAARSGQELRVSDDVALGSAVAISKNRLLTNCHVIKGRPFLWLKQGKTLERAKIAAADGDTDRCVLSVDSGTLVPVAGMRKYDDLRVGEEVYSIGSPSGLESSLGQGIISGLRRLETRRLVQTTAQISPGSSGGGLFDRSGNLIGITTFALRDTQSLNFAIAAEDYFR